MKADYSAAWHNFRRRRMIAWAVLLGLVPGMALFSAVSVLLSKFTGIEPDYFMYPVAGVWMAAVIVTSMREQYFPCPRCGKRFFATWWYQNPFARKCVHCGLPKWAGSDDQLSN